MRGQLHCEGLNRQFVWATSDIPQAFVMALIETAADTTARFMLANASCDERYCGLGFEMLWSGLSAIDAPGEESK